ncbi:MAG: hypothetical protein ACREF3_04575 [Acetobacteraceae bacterium]
MEVTVRTHRERVVLFRRMEQLSLSRALPHAAAHWSAAAAEAEGRGHVITQAIAKLKKPVLVGMQHRTAAARPLLLQLTGRASI